MYNKGGPRRKPSGFGRATKAAETGTDPNNAILCVFSAAAKELDDRHDRYERLVKLSRDITIESKRIIFLLHTAIKESERKKVISEAGKRLEALRVGVIQKAAKELEQSPLYLYSRALSPGFQEYVEAATLYGWLLKGTIPLHEDLQTEFSFPTSDDGSTQRLSIALPYPDYILGLADLTGELMRRCINVLSNGDSAECSTLSQLLQLIQIGFLSLGGAGYEVSRKMYAMRNNVRKAEAIVYAIHVRGSEAPLSLLLPPLSLTHPTNNALHNGDSDDEGFF